MQAGDRRHSRPPHCFGAVLIHLPRLYELALLDISLHAALLAPGERVEVGLGEATRLRVLTRRGNQACEVQAVIAYRSERGIGLEIDASEQPAMRSLQRLIGVDLVLGDRLGSRSLADLIEANLGAAALTPAPAVCSAAMGRRAPAIGRNSA